MPVRLSFFAFFDCSIKAMFAVQCLCTSMYTRISIYTAHVYALSVHMLEDCSEMFIYAKQHTNQHNRQNHYN